MLPPTAERVRQNTTQEINERIRRSTQANVNQVKNAGPEAINRRLAELDREWDIERYLETLAPSITLAGLFLGATVSRKWLLFPALVKVFFLQHTLQGWCPPIPVLRRFGVRTSEEINEERNALKVLRGDYRMVANPGNQPSASRTADVMEAVRR